MKWRNVYENIVKKLLAVSLCAAMVGGAALTLPVFVPDSGITASAADTLTYGDFEYTVLDDSTIQITKYKANSTSVKIPSKIDGKSVTSIRGGTFFDCNSLTSVTIPSSVTSIGDCAFGYNWNNDTHMDEKIEGFTIYGKSGSAAETYAKNNEFKFVSTSADTELKNSSAISATTVTAGTEVTLNGKATGGTAPYKYAYYYKKSTDSTYTKAYVTSSGSAYTKYDSVKFAPKTAGTYTVRINVKDKYGEGTTVTKDFKLTVK